MEDVHPLTLCFSHLAAGTLLSPLLLVRTRFTLKLIPRLIAQSLAPNRKKYFGPFHALYVISREEKPTPSASILSTFYSFQALFPTIILSTITPLLKKFSKLKTPFLFFVRKRKKYSHHIDELLNCKPRVDAK